MSSEENATTAQLAADQASVVAAAARPQTPLSSDLAPYDATTPWRAGAALGATVLICAVTVVIALGGSVVLMAMVGDPAAASTDGRVLFVMLLAQIVMTVGAVLAARAKGGVLVSVLALKAPAGGFWVYARSLALMLAAVGVFTMLSHFVLGHDATTDLVGMADMFRSRWWPLALVVLGIGAPFSEELLFRGFLQSALVPTRLGYWGAAAVTTALWTGMHAGYSVVGLVEVFLIGLVFCYILRRTGSLRVTLACHAIYNTGIALAVIFAPKSWLGF